MKCRAQSWDSETELNVTGDYCDGYLYVEDNGDGTFNIDIDVDCWGDYGDENVSTMMVREPADDYNALAIEIASYIEAEYGCEGLGIDTGYLAEQFGVYFPKTAKRAMNRRRDMMTKKMKRAELIEDMSIRYETDYSLELDIEQEGDEWKCDAFAVHPVYIGVDEDATGYGDTPFEAAEDAIYNLGEFFVPDDYLLNEIDNRCSDIEAEARRRRARKAYRIVAEEGDVWVEDADGVLLPEDEYDLDEEELVDEAEEKIEDAETDDKQDKMSRRRAARRRALKKADITEELEAIPDDADDEQILDGIKMLLNDIRALSMSELGGFLNVIVADEKTRRFLNYAYSTYAEFHLDLSETAIPVKQLYPTQIEIGLANSLGWPLGGKADIASYYNSPVTAGSPIVTYNGSYIVDGHHRWSQVYMMNPEASITALNFTGHDVDPSQILRDLQAEIALQIGHVPSSANNVADVYTMSEDEIRTYIEGEMPEGCPVDEQLCEQLGMEHNEVVEFLTGNALELAQNNAPVPTAPERKDMPQTDDINIDEFDDASDV